MKQVNAANVKPSRTNQDFIQRQEMESKDDFKYSFLGTCFYLSPNKLNISAIPLNILHVFTDIWRNGHVPGSNLHRPTGEWLSEPVHQVPP